MRLGEIDPGEAIAEEIAAFAPLDRRRHDVERGGLHALAGAIDRGEAKHVMRVGDLRGIAVGRDLTHVVDHASASQSGSDRSLWVR